MQENNGTPCASGSMHALTNGVTSNSSGTEPPSTLMEVTSTVWDLRQQLSGALTETVVAHVHRGEHQRQKVACPKCDRVLQARENRAAP